MPAASRTTRPRPLGHRVDPPCEGHDLRRGRLPDPHRARPGEHGHTAQPRSQHTPRPWWRTTRSPAWCCTSARCTRPRRRAGRPPTRPSARGLDRDRALPPGKCQAESLADRRRCGVGWTCRERLCRRLGLPAGRTRLLRLLQAPAVPAPSPRVLGVDEFAFRKGRTYGTVLVDVEAARVIDVLPDRTSQTFAAWLREHPGVEVICRGRASTYSRAVKEAAPNATEVADRWHLLQNLSPRSRVDLPPAPRL
ncbi:transposase [Streptomyces sp. NPDC020983]|uniref:transposase n=1 Tax=Streptomyces sp. NPDC020983 TaxID=3365106 RepID=UPI00378DEAB6